MLAGDGSRVKYQLSLPVMSLPLFVCVALFQPRAKRNRLARAGNETEASIFFI
jgi:hypothetical protein